MTQKSFFWDGASVGDADTWTRGGGYHMGNLTYESPWETMCRALFNGTGNRGPLKGWANELEVTGAATPVSIATGSAFVYGLYYENTAVVNEAIGTPTSDTRYDRVVVRRNWHTQRARIDVITGTEGGSIPALTQSPAPSGTGIYDIPLATLQVTTAGVITVTDDREFCTFSTVGTSTSNQFTTVNFANDSVGLSGRAPREKILFFGGGDLEPNVASGVFSYSGPFTVPYASVLTQAGPPTWGGGAATVKGWRANGTSTGYKGLYATFSLPADFVPGSSSITGTYVWWVNNATVASGSASLVTAYHYLIPYSELNYYPTVTTDTFTISSSLPHRPKALIFLPF